MLAQVVLIALVPLFVAGFEGRSPLVAHAQTADSALVYQRFEIVEEGGSVLEIKPVPSHGPPPIWARDVRQERTDWKKAESSQTPYFEGPISYVIPSESGEGDYIFSHYPSLAWLPNGDLLITWLTGRLGRGSMASRFRSNSQAWDPYDEFFNPEDRQAGPNSIFQDGTGRIIHVAGIRESDRGILRLALVVRYSDDNGVTWTKATPVPSAAHYANRHQCGSDMFRMVDGTLVLPCDVNRQGSSVILMSDDEGKTWLDPGGTIRGIHPAVAQTSGGDLIAFGRHDGLLNARDRWLPDEGSDEYLLHLLNEGADPAEWKRMAPLSKSVNAGYSWQSKASPFPVIGAAQRAVLERLREGPLLLVSFAGDPSSDNIEEGQEAGIVVTDESGQAFRGFGMYAALSFDDGETWPIRKLLTPGEGEFDGGGEGTGVFRTARDRAEPAGYLSATQTPDGVIHLVTSRLHYRFNLAWLLAGTGMTDAIEGLSTEWLWERAMW